jgi:hypothetical protein
VHGWIKTDNAKDATLRGKLYTSRTGTEVASGDIGTLVSGTTDWTFFSGDITAPAGVTFVDLFMESKGPSTGTGYTWFDDVGVIEWTDWITYDGTGSTVYPNDIYWLQVRNPAVVDNATVIFREAGFIDLAQPSSVVAAVQQGWNLISNPVLRADSLHGVRSLYPSSIFNYAFDFSAGSGYHQSSVLETGKGYWEKFAEPASVEIAGSPIVRDSVIVGAGWNLIGSVTYPVDTAAIVSVPPGLIASRYFGYSGGYFPLDVLTPGAGYWVKCNSTGVIVLEGTARALALGRRLADTYPHVTISDARGEKRHLYLPSDGSLPLELPPPPPHGELDVRCERQEGIDGGQSAGEFPVQISSATYPLQIAWSDFDSNGKLKLKVGETIKELRGSGEIGVVASGVHVSILYTSSQDVPVIFGLDQNYPNPFNPVTTLRYALPARTPVHLQVYSVTGQLVKTLVNGTLDAGRYETLWQGENDAGISVGSGVYFCRLMAGGHTRSIKVLLMK